MLGGEFLRVVESVLDLQQDCTPLRYLSQYNERLAVLTANFASMQRKGFSLRRQCAAIEPVAGLTSI